MNIFINNFDIWYPSPKYLKAFPSLILVSPLLPEKSAEDGEVIGKLGARSQVYGEDAEGDQEVAGGDAVDEEIQQIPKIPDVLDLNMFWLFTLFSKMFWLWDKLEIIIWQFKID